MVSKHFWRASSLSVELKSSFLVFQAFHSVRTAPPVAFHPPERDDTRARAPRPRSRYQSAGALPTLATESYLYPYTASVTTLPHVAARGFSHGRAERTEQQLPPKSRHVRSAFTLSTEGCMLTYAELRGYAHQKCADGCRLPPKRSMDACHRLAPRGCFPLVRACVGKCRISPADFAKDFGNAELGPPETVLWREAPSGVENSPDIAPGACRDATAGSCETFTMRITMSAKFTHHPCWITRKFLMYCFLAF